MRQASFQLQKVLDKCDVTAYRLAQATGKRLSRTAIYRLINHPPLRVDLETLATLLDAFEELGCEVELNDLIVVSVVRSAS
jgi:hypothetical protein